MSDNALRLIASYVEEAAAARARFFADHAELVDAAARTMAVALARGGKILFCGNGGSAADAQHLAAEFVNRFELERPPLPALALTTDSSALTAIGNDYGFDRVFAKQVQALAGPSDVVVGISTSGNSPNVLAALRAAGLELAPTPFSPVGLRVKGKPPINRHPLFLEGAVEVQDEGSQLLGLLVGARRGEMVVDFCAGAGGKTLHLGAMMASRGRLYAFDVSEKRLANLKPRLARSGLSNVTPQLIQNENDSKIKRLAGKVDRVLVDAPCSGLGTLRRNPDLKFRQSPASIAELNKTQASILARAAQLVKPGGRLVYATCSVLPAENDAIVDAFLAAHPEFSETPVNTLLEQAGVALDTGSRLRLLPGVHSTDGFFAAVLTRTPPVNEQEVDEQENEPAEAVETAGPTDESE